MRIDHIPRLRVLAVSSGGGHWDELMLLRDAFAGHEIFYATTIAGLLERDGVTNGILLHDCNRNRIGDTVKCVIQAARTVRRLRPDVVVSTGAAPGLFCLLFGWLTGARTIWVDSIANAERVSMSGRAAGRFATVWLTQWRHLAHPRGPEYAGELL
jgi:UDP-N-acetylglucosamine:LPS N-acetylglucosamine transferase